MTEDPFEAARRIQQEQFRVRDADAEQARERQAAADRISEQQRDYFLAKQEQQRLDDLAKREQQPPSRSTSSGGSASSDCFVATAVYGNEDHPDVRTLRFFRDNFLSQNIAGRCFIYFYYQIGSSLARLVLFLSIHEFIRRRLIMLTTWLRAIYNLD